MQAKLLVVMGLNNVRVGGDFCLVLIYSCEKYLFMKERLPFTIINNFIAKSLPVISQVERLLYNAHLSDEA